jgi:hypothetical protein
MRRTMGLINRSSIFESSGLCLFIPNLNLCKSLLNPLPNGRSVLLGAFAKFRKATISVVMFVCPRGTTRLTLDGFSLNLISEDFFFGNVSTNFKFR